MKKTYKPKNVLAVFTGILVTGFILNTLYELTPKEIVGIDNARFEREYKQDIEYIEETPQEETILVEAVSIDPKQVERERRITNIRNFLEGRNSPLAKYAEEFVDAAQEYGIDYRLVAAISIVESSGGLYNFRPYNAWGWGSYGFEDWKDGIWSVSEGLGKYYARGLDTPYEIGRVYCPPSSDSWSRKVWILL